MRQPLNLERILCKSSFSSNEAVPSVKRCGKNCYCCDYIKEGNQFIFKKNSFTFIIKTNFSCESRNLIYVIVCSGCKEEYIGQTKTMLKERLNIYRQHIRQPELQMMRNIYENAEKEVLKLCLSLLFVKTTNN